VNKISVGYIYDFQLRKHLIFGVGGLGSIHLLPGGTSSYGETPLSFMLFAHVKL
jgi:hypothetical protein